jgi:uncharacterized Zn finger protein
MSRRYPWEIYKPTPKQPPPEHGVKMKQAGATWWGQRWIEALTEVLSGDAGRLARGRTYARAGRTHDFVVQAGKVTAKVTGSRARPYEVTIELAQIDERAWSRAIAGMAAKSQFSAELLAGRMPQAIDEVFRAAGRSLFPRRRADLVTSCSCPDWGDPCKHVSAAHYVLGEALDRDPFLLFELRGRSKDEVLRALRTARTGGATPAKPSRRTKRARKRAPIARVGEPDVPKVKLGRIEQADYDRPREALPSLHFSFDPPVAGAAVLRQLGAPVAWGREDTPADVLEPAVRAAADAARRIALGEPQPSGARPAVASGKKPTKSAPPRSGNE